MRGVAPPDCINDADIFAGLQKTEVRPGMGTSMDIHDNEVTHSLVQQAECDGGIYPSGTFHNPLTEEEALKRAIAESMYSHTSHAQGTQEMQTAIQCKQNQANDTLAPLHAKMEQMMIDELKEKDEQMKLCCQRLDDAQSQIHDLAQALAKCESKLAKIKEDYEEALDKRHYYEDSARSLAEELEQVYKYWKASEKKRLLDAGDDDAEDPVQGGAPMTMTAECEPCDDEEVAMLYKII